MNRLSFIFIVLFLFLTGCNTRLVDNTDIDFVTVDTSETIETFADPSVSSSFAVHYIDVGHADAAIVLCDGEAMLIDGGKDSDSDIINKYLKKLNIKHLDYIIATHAHKDHVGGLSDILKKLTAGKVYAPQTQAVTNEYKNFLDSVEKQKLKIITPETGDKISLGTSIITFLGPIKETYDDLNDTSIVLRIEYDETSFLFTGDAGRESEADIIAAGYALKSTVLKVGHHGYASSATYDFLQEVKPEYAVISCDQDISDGEPSEEVLNRLHEADIKIYRTDMQDDIIAMSNGKTVTFTASGNIDSWKVTAAAPETIKTGDKKYLK